MDLRSKFICLVLPIILGMCLASCTRSPDKADRKKIDAIVAEMTLEEKAALVVGTGRNMPGADGATSVALTEKLVPGAAGTTAEITRLGIT
ncbi:MAG: hypothetical protein JW896_13675, partial [Deltaproteobacteria bacterium]|nr:hypothetical protein [Deltaproteobacteria bacterium]